MNVRAEIFARGQVQRVGYRDVVERAARDLNLTGFVANVKPYDVRIVCEGKRSAIDAFLEQIRLTKYPLEVKDLAVSFKPATGEYEYFEIKRGNMAEELGERLDLARTDMTKMIEKQDLMVRKQEETIQVIKEEGEKTREVVRDESEKTRELIGAEGEKTRATLRGTLEDDMVWVKDEIVGIKVTLNKVKEKVGVE